MKADPALRPLSSGTLEEEPAGTGQCLRGAEGTWECVALDSSAVSPGDGETDQGLDAAGLPPRATGSAAHRGGPIS